MTRPPEDFGSFTTTQCGEVTLTAFEDGRIIVRDNAATYVSGSCVQLDKSLADTLYAIMGSYRKKD